MGYYDVDYDEIAWPNVPVPERDPFTNSWLIALITPLRYVYTLFTSLRLEVVYYLAHSAQVCFMEAVLNDIFDKDLRRITINDGPFRDSVPVYMAAENKPVALYRSIENKPVTLYKSAETVNAGVQFIVNVPADATTQPGYSLARVKSVVNKYRLASKSNYQIILF